MPRQDLEKVAARSANARRDRPAPDRRARRNPRPRSRPCRAAGRAPRASAAAWPGSSGVAVRRARSSRAPAGSAAGGGAIRGSPAAPPGSRRRRLPPLPKRNLVGVEIADRPHPRQQQRRAGVAALAGQPQKRLAQRPHRAPGRQQHGHPRQPQRVAAGQRRAARAPASPETAGRARSCKMRGGAGRERATARCGARRGGRGSRRGRRGVPT